MPNALSGDRHASAFMCSIYGPHGFNDFHSGTILEITNGMTVQVELHARMAEGEISCNNRVSDTVVIGEPLRKPRREELVAAAAAYDTSALAGKYMVISRKDRGCGLKSLFPLSPEEYWRHHDGFVLTAYRMTEGSTRLGSKIILDSNFFFGEMPQKVDVVKDTAKYILPKDYAIQQFRAGTVFKVLPGAAANLWSCGDWIGRTVSPEEAGECKPDGELQLEYPVEYCSPHKGSIFLAKKLGTEGKKSITLGLIMNTQMATALRKKATHPEDLEFPA